MTKSLWFVIPAYRRFELTRLCLEHLAQQTIPELRRFGIVAQGVVVADDDNCRTAHELGFWVVEQANMPLGRKFNDGIQLACEKGAEYITPLGTDNWIMGSMLTELPKRTNEVVCRRLMSAVREDGQKIAYLRVGYEGGDGIRTFDADLFRAASSRPAADYAKRAVDTSIFDRLKRVGWSHRECRYEDVDQLQVISFQSAKPEPQLNEYKDLLRGFGKEERDNPWDVLAEVYDDTHIARMRDFYERSSS